jgi:small-conductance mechanosensitive channel
MWENLYNQLHALPYYFFNTILALAAILSGLLFKGMASLVLHYYSKRDVDYSLFRSIVKRLNAPLTFFLPLIVLNFVVPLMHLNKTALHSVDKASSIFLIIVFAWLLISIIKIGEDYVYHSFDLKQRDNLRQRKIRTQLQFLRKVAIGLIIVLAAGAILLSFSSLRRLGTGLLTGVGISGLIIGFAAQRSLANLLAGFQIAFTQPLRIDDVLVVEGEFGKVEEINLTYVVLNIWDQRRLILPINYFLEKPFQNWTRSSAEIMGTVFLHLDYNAPIKEIRAAFLKLLEHTPLWDKRAGVLQVTNTTEQTIEVRALMSAANASQAFDLRCYIRENLIAFIAKNHPEALPKRRSIMEKESELIITEEKPANKEG